MTCTRCNTELVSGYTLKANTYGTIHIEKGQGKDAIPQVWVCPDCGKVEMSIDVSALK